jgi:hypothetical protein
MSAQFSEEMNMARSQATTDHTVIRRWIETRKGHPSVVRATANSKQGGAGLLRVDFGTPEDSLEEIGWDDFFDTFDQSGLAFLFQDKTSSGRTSRFHKFVNRDSVEETDESASDEDSSSSRQAASKSETGGKSGGSKGGGSKRQATPQEEEEAEEIDEEDIEDEDEDADEDEDEDEDEDLDEDDADDDDDDDDEIDDEAEDEEEEKPKRGKR